MVPVWKAPLFVFSLPGSLLICSPKASMGDKYCHSWTLEGSRCCCRDFVGMRLMRHYLADSTIFFSPKISHIEVGMERAPYLSGSTKRSSGAAA